ncbi:LEAF RUST 10 DISEASE-RESISTANCE LOCUS RECEPTOR-LIKE PROTEIN KINASE-like protein 2.1 isoform X1 [Cinnamomum micranthum f. kanehirae]|uniref:LEAF RUST 10 DISEASE-RESISTANCE LOCUS RECEPTOR-LIKE PROTEIN KINASE-like protein 2.1 isoform X1 n=1 Tax=Cinnamomum micranthum f. kanehirae TaxID=337451 RepID=A0A443P1S3_9MAGN|nr:LEAF RUST 10 DISEASE-RESISTANCE LOCUS RECEPTOR-LIKE PROTEIN KINASE-like protein 2.1 isoform X1 [Cinnamomum micranthum f. kanehirae]
MASLFSQSPLSQAISFLLIIIIFFFSTTKSQQQTSTDPSYYYNLCAPSTCGNLTFSYPFSLPNLCHHPRLNSTCQDNNQHLVLQGQPQSDPHRVISNITINGPNFTIPIASNALFRCGHISKPNFVTDSSIFSISDKYTYGTHLNCTRRPANGQALMPVSCLGCEGDADPNVCYYMQGFVSFPECESFYIYPPKGVNVSAEKDLRGFLKKGLEITYTMSSECESCQGSGGRCGARPDGSFACFCPSSVHTQNCSDEVIDLRTWKPVARKSGGSKVLVVALSTSASIVILIALATLVGIFFYWQKSRRLKDNEKGMDNKDMPQTDLKDVVKGISPTRYSYPEIKKFTNNFATKLGEGGFGSVYKGIIHGSGNDVNVAIKLLKISKQSEKQFKNEVATVGRIHHQHLVRLLGYCVQGKRRALVYEFMENGSLDKYIYRTKKEGNEVEEDNDFEPLSSKQLYNIALETARGLLYLHEGCRSRILHCDIKPHNVLLDSKFSAKVSDFGLARMIDKDHSHVSFTAIQGTPEYMAPEMWSKSYGVTEKSDVYSYGMLLMEIVGGRKNYDSHASVPSQVYFPDWVYKKLDKVKDKSETSQVDMTEIVGEVMDKEDAEVLDHMCLVGLWCIQHIPSNRPSMSRVIQMLEGNANIPTPPNPFPEDGAEMRANFLTKPTVYLSARDESIEKLSQ